MNIARTIPHRCLLVALAFATCLGGGIAVAQDLRRPDAPLDMSDIDAIFNWATPDCPGCAIAVSMDGKLVASRAYGSADLDHEAPITTGTIFDAGSLQKQFIAASVLLLVDEGSLSLSDDVRKHIPELPRYAHTITIDHLLTHTSGIRDWTAILPFTSGNEDALTVILRQRGLNFAPGEEWGYSNSGYVLAREIVARVSGMSFADFTRTRIFEPLGMAFTMFCADIEGVPGDRAMAYDKEGDRWRPAVMLGQARGGGAVFTTPGDLILWNDALMKNRLGEFVSAKLREPATLNNGRKLDYCRGLILDSYRGATEVWHTGSADGYKSFLGHYPEHGLSIAIMCNSGDGTDRIDFAHRIFDLHVPNADAPVREEGSGPPPMIPEDLAAEVSSKTGFFMNERTGEMLHLAVDRGRFRVAGGPGLVAVTADHFRRWGASTQFMSADAFELHFRSPDEFDLQSMEGDTTRYRRVEPFAPTQDELQALAGRFESDEIGTIVQIEPGDSGLVLRLEHSPDRSAPLKPIAPDMFQVARTTIRFRRDEHGGVVGFDYSNPLVRNIPFTTAPAR